MKRYALAIALLLSLGVNVGLIGMQLVRSREAERRERGTRWSEQAIGERLARRLNLDGNERERFLGQQRKLARSVLEGRRRIHALRGELRAELVAPAPDRARVDTLLAEIVAAQAAIDRAVAENVLESRALLSGDAERAYLRFVERFAGEMGPGRDGLPRFPGGAPRGARPPGRGAAPPPDDAPPPP